jgi:hypothetical protein
MQTPCHRELRHSDSRDVHFGSFVYSTHGSSCSVATNTTHRNLEPAPSGGPATETTRKKSVTAHFPPSSGKNLGSCYKRFARCIHVRLGWYPPESSKQGGAKATVHLVWPQLGLRNRNLFRRSRDTQSVLLAVMNPRDDEPTIKTQQDDVLKPDESRLHCCSSRGCPESVTKRRPL